MLLQKVQKFFLSRHIYKTLAAFLAGILISILPNFVLAGGIPVMLAIGLVTAVAGVMSLVLRRQPMFDILIKSPQTIRSDAEAKRYARKVFIGFVPLFTPQNEAVKALSREERDEAVRNLDFDRLKLEASNFKPTIRAIVSHKDRLEHCWLLATTGTRPDAVGSLAYAHLLAEYLKQRHGINSTFYYGDNYAISLDEDSQVLSKTYDLVQQVFREIPNRSTPREVVADITTGFRSMTLGMVLACLDEERDVEFVGTRYDENGKPDGSLVPIIFSFKPNVREKSQ